MPLPREFTAVLSYLQLLRLATGLPVLVVAAGDTRVDSRKLGALRSVSRRKVKMVSRGDCVRIFGFAPGGVSPIGLRTACDVIVDACVG